MLSCETGVRILGDARIGDQLEKVAFNAFPAVLSKNLHQVQYYQLPNQVMSTWVKHGYRNDYENSLMPSTRPGVQCCAYNWHMGWPKLVQNSWAATNGNGLGIMVYGPTTVSAKVANGVSVTITENTNYPFEEQIRLSIALSGAVAFPLKLRIPGWCGSPSITVNGTAQSGIIAASFYTINRTWNNGDSVVINFPMTIKTSTWFNNSVGIERGPLAYSLKIGENWRVKYPYTFNGEDYGE
jgi:DUF1680 family protein